MSIVLEVGRCTWYRFTTLPPHLDSNRPRLAPRAHTLGFLSTCGTVFVHGFISLVFGLSAHFEPSLEFIAPPSPSFGVLAPCPPSLRHYPPTRDHPLFGVKPLRPLPGSNWGPPGSWPGSWKCANTPSPDFETSLVSGKRI